MKSNIQVYILSYLSNLAKLIKTVVSSDNSPVSNRFAMTTDLANRFPQKWAFHSFRRIRDICRATK